MFNLLKYDETETWKLITINNEKSINKKLITYINVQLKSLLKKLYKTISEIKPKQDDFEQEFIKTIKYFLQPQFNLYNKIDRFFILNKSTNNLYVKKSWPTYKPIYDNKLVSKITFRFVILNHMKDFMFKKLEVWLVLLILIVFISTWLPT